MRTHFTWSIEEGTARGDACPFCGGLGTLVVVAHEIWAVYSATDPPPPEEYLHDGAQVEEEITGHWCPKCRKLVSLSLNTLEHPQEKAR